MNAVHALIIQELTLSFATPLGQYLNDKYEKAERIILIRRTKFGRTYHYRNR